MTLDDAELARVAEQYGLNAPKTAINPITGEPDIPDGFRKRCQAAGHAFALEREKAVLEALLGQGAAPFTPRVPPR